MKLNPVRLIILIYIAIILLGTLLLSLPVSGDVSLLDAAFTATSATCVTGLIVRDTQKDFTIFGRFVILLLIQIGGIGYMTFATLFFILRRKDIPMFQRFMMKEQWNLLSLSGLRKFIKIVLLTTASFELGGFLILFPRFLKAGYPVHVAAGHALFHAVSAFCNAGFSSFSTNLNGIKDPLIVFPVAFLFISGGLGFIFWQNVRYRKFFYHSRIVLWTTGMLILFPFLLVLFTEWNAGFSNLSPFYRIEYAFFTVVTPRTAGFSVIDLKILNPISQLLLMILMFVGASPGGTGGGIKTTTAFILLSFLFTRLRGRDQVNVLGRRIGKETIERAFTLFLLALLILSVDTLVLGITERALIEERGILPLLFEEFSALGTVGLSLGSSQVPSLSLSHDLTGIGKFVIMLTMLLGRVGPLSLLATVGGRKETFTYPEGKVLVG
ncbi:hypothetical protein DRQ18_00535 [bacterium]|nr:MAG: hypothetical protein DRQ18_00535 [bacterium]